MRRVLLLCVVIAAALVACRLLREETPTADGERATGAAPVTSPPTKAPGGSARRVVVGETPTPPTAQPPRAVEKIAATDAVGTLLVVDAAAGQALAGVRVAFLPLGADESKWPKALFTLGWTGVDPTDEDVEQGRAFVSDAQGKVSLPKFDGTAFVAARHGELHGSSRIRVGEPNWRLELHRALALAARVEGADGRPCGGVRVLFLRRTEFVTPLGDATTGADDGVARFADAFATVSREEDGSWELGVALPFAGGPSAAVDPKRPPDEPIRLVLPPSGRVRCDVVDERGATASASPVVVLRRVAGDGKDAAGVPSYEYAEANVEGGAARFPYVGLGLRLEVQVTSPDASRVTVKQTFAGPTAAGEETVVRVTLGGRRPAVVGRLADAKGAPIAGFDLVAGIVEPGRSTDLDPFGRTRSTTDANGRFRFSFDRAAGDAASAKLEIGREVRRGTFTSPSRIALVDLPSVLPDGDVDVGDVVFRGTGLLVAGVVVDEEGRPLAGATVAAMTTRGGARRSPLRDVDSVVSDSDGRFRLEGEPSGDRVLVGAALDGRYGADDLAFAAGTTDARVALLHAGGIAGSVRVPAGRRPREVRVVVYGVPADNGDTGYRFGGEGLSTWIDADGKFEVRTLRPGRARVSIRLGWNEADTVLVVDDVEVVAGQVTRDPRLQDVDPSKSLSAIKIVVRDADGKPVKDAGVHFRPAGSDEYWKEATATDADGAATVQAKSEDASGRGLDVVVTCRGCRSGLVRAAKADATIVLERAKSSVMTVHLASGSPLPEPPFQLGASLNWVEPGARDEAQEWHDPRSVRQYGAKFGKDRVLTFETSDAGRYRVELMLWEMNMSGGGGSGIDSVPETVFVTVGADGAPAEVFVGVDADELKRRTSEKR